MTRFILNTFVIFLASILRLILICFSSPFLKAFVLEPSLRFSHFDSPVTFYKLCLYSSTSTHAFRFSCLYYWDVQEIGA